MTVKKYIKNIGTNKVAVIISPDYGAGWSTWNHEYPELLFDHQIAYMVEQMNELEEEDPRRQDWVDNITDYCKIHYTQAYLGAVPDLQLVWLEEGVVFRVHEYDGSETIEIRDLMRWNVA